MTRVRRRCAETGCRHTPRAHTKTGCALCACRAWLGRKRHTWREDVTDAWFLATQTWLEHRERVAVDYPTEEREFEEKHPRPRLADFMRAMSLGSPAEDLTALFTYDICTACRGTGVHPTLQERQAS